MKFTRKILALLCLVLFLFTAAVSCAKKDDAEDAKGDDNQGDIGDNQTPDKPEEEIKGDYIFSPTTVVNLVYNGDHLTHAGVSEIYYAISNLIENPPMLVNDSSAVGEHEIVIGKSERPVSKEAYRRLSQLERESSDYHGYLIYSDGNSVAIAYDEDIFELHMAQEDALEYFMDTYLSESVLRIKKGVAKSDLFNIVDRQKALDEIKVNEAWKSVEKTLTEQVGAEKASAIVQSFRNFYQLFSDDVIYWFANLYDPAVGGYYYSNSGRNTVGYGPDLESTYQALSFMGGTGMAEGINTAKGEDVIPEWMRGQIVKFVKSLQDPESGYFYHPQWGGESFADRKNLIDSGYVSRRGRDLKWALSLLSRFGASPTYDIMNVKGDGLLADGTPVNKNEPASKVSLTSKLINAKAASVSKIVAASSNIPTHLQSADNLRKYLEKQDVNGDSYYVGNLIESQSNQIVERDKQIGVPGNKTPLADVVKEFFDSHQNQENGAWTLGSEIDYESVNGILKICGAYNGVGKEFPNPVKAIQTAMKGITISDPPTTVCFVLNPWYAITMLMQNVEEYNSSSNKAEVEAQIAELRLEILDNAVELIDVTREKTAAFLKDDGSFSYFPGTSGPNSQGVPVAVPGSVEGDVNATHMFISGISNHIWGILGCEVVPVYTVSDRMRYWTILNELGEIVKDKEKELIPMDYEEEDLGTSLPYGVTAQYGKDSKAAVVQTNNRLGKTTKALALTTVPGSTDILRLSLDNYAIFYNAVVFEADLKIEANGGGQFEMLPYGSPGDAYRIIIDYSEGGNVTVRHINDFAQTVIGKEGQWINIKLQYSYADIDYDRNGTKDLYVKFFADNKLIFEGYTPQGAEPVKESSVSGVRFFSWTSADSTLYLDNTLFYQSSVELKPAPIVNPEDESERITFEESTNENIPGKVATGDVSDTSQAIISNAGSTDAPDKVFGLISSAKKDTVKFYLTKKLVGANAVAFETDIKIDAVSDSGEIDFTLSTLFNSTAAKLVFSYTKGGDITVKKIDASGNAEFTNTLAKEGEWFKLRVEYTASAKGLSLKIYAGETLIGEGTALYNNFHAGENISTAALTVKENIEAEIYLDDIMFAQEIVTSQDQTPDNEGVDFEDLTNDYSSDIEYVLSENGTAQIVETVRYGRLTKALMLQSPQKSLDLLKLKFKDEGKEETNTVAFEADIKITDADGGNILTIYHNTSDGTIANKMVVGWSAGTGNIFMLNMYNVSGGTAKDFDTVVVSEGMNSFFKLRIEYTKLSDTEVLITMYVNGNKIADIGNSHPYDTSAIDADDISEVVIETYQSRKTTLYIDNLIIERTKLDVKVEEEPTPEPPTPPTPDVPETPTEPGEEYDGSIYDETVDGNTSSDGWT